jgi:lipopolysaccharide export system permease protein
MLKKLDIYIIRKFLGTTFFILGVIMSLAVVFDVSERIDDFVSRDAPLKAIIFEYYVNFVFFYSSLFSGLIIFIAVILFTSKMAADTEIIAILTGSVSFLRFLRPYFIGATILVVLSLYMNHWVIPKANAERLAFEENYVGYHVKSAQRNTHVTLSPESHLFLKVLVALIIWDFICP